MKKRTMALLVLLCIAAGLSACSVAGDAATDTQPIRGLNTDYPNALPAEAQLAIGTLKLDGTQNAIDSQAAGQLLILWQAVRSLSAKNDTATQEIDALYQQIEETMTPAQIQAIAAMQLTQDDMLQEAQALGLNFAAGGGFNQGSQPSTQATPPGSQSARSQSAGNGFPPDGGLPPDGGIPGDGGFPGGGFAQPQQTPNATTRATAQARLAGNGGLNRVPTAWLEALINYLQGKS
jgi:hypothetical protein